MTASRKIRLGRLAAIVAVLTALAAGAPGAAYQAAAAGRTIPTGRSSADSSPASFGPSRRPTLRRSFRRSHPLKSCSPLIHEFTHSLDTAQSTARVDAQR